MTRRWRTLRYGGAFTVAVVGVACGAAIPGMLGGTLATVLIGVGLVGVLSLVFYEVGISEDRERARAAASAKGHAQPPAPAPPPASSPSSAQRPRPAAPIGPDRPRRLDRGRGERRRLR